jgi:hypothetical protein
MFITIQAQDRLALMRVCNWVELDFRYQKLKPGAEGQALIHCSLDDQKGQILVSLKRLIQH